MKLEEIDSLFARIKRLFETLSVKAGSGTSWNYTFPSGKTQTFHLKNVRPPEQIEDDVANMAIWTWSMKDHLKELATARHMDAKFIEDEIDDNYVLKICGDLANLLKHGRLKKSRSGEFPKLLRPQYEMTQEAIGSMTFAESEVTTSVSKPELVEISVPIQVKDGQVIGDALVFLRIATIKWEELRDQIIK